MLVFRWETQGETREWPGQGQVEIWVRLGVARLRPGDSDGAVEEAQPRVHGEEQDQGGALHDQQELASCDVHNQEAVQTTSLIDKNTN